MTTMRTFIIGVLVGLLAASATVAIAAGSGTVDRPPRIAFVAHAFNPADALAVGPLAGQLGAPLFTTSPSGLSPAASAGLAGYAPELVVVAGGPGALPDPILDQIRTATGLSGDDVSRVAGDDRTATAAAIASFLEDRGFHPLFLPVDATAADSDLLDGLDADAFQPAGDYVDTADPRLQWYESIPLSNGTGSADWSVGGGPSQQGLRFPGTENFSRTTNGFTLPPSYVPGDDIEVVITWGNENAPDAVDCDFRLESNGWRAVRGGMDVYGTGSFPDDGYHDDWGAFDDHTLLRAPSDQAAIGADPVVMVIDGGEGDFVLRPWDTISFAVNRDADESNDTCAGDLYLMGAFARSRTAG